jgi:glycine cleavage system regulatory protein
MAKVYLVVTAVGQDRRGTVKMITDVVVTHFANIEESRMARLGGEFAVTERPQRQRPDGHFAPDGSFANG